MHDPVHHVHHVIYSDDPPEHLHHEYAQASSEFRAHRVLLVQTAQRAQAYADAADDPVVPGQAKPDWSHVYLSQQHLDPSKARAQRLTRLNKIFPSRDRRLQVPAEWMDDSGGKAAPLPGLSSA